MSTTLQDMQRIEAEAKALGEQYQQQLQALDESIETRLNEVRQTYDGQTDQLVEDLTKELAAEQAQLQAELDQTVADNQALVAKVLAEHKTQWVNYIVEKVVTQYGH